MCARTPGSGAPRDGAPVGRGSQGGGRKRRSAIAATTWPPAPPRHKPCRPATMCAAGRGRAVVVGAGVWGQVGEEETLEHEAFSRVDPMIQRKQAAHLTHLPPG